MMRALTAALVVVVGFALLAAACTVMSLGGSALALWDDTALPARRVH